MKKDQSSIDRELRELSPFLHDLRSKEDGFHLPENYFDGLEEQVFQQIDALGARRKPVRTTTARTGFWNSLAWLWQPRVAIAFSILLVAAFAVWWMWQPKPSVIETNIPLASQIELTPEELEAYVMENVNDFEPEQLALLAIAEDENSEPPKTPAPKTNTSTRNEKSGPDDLSPEELELLLDDLTDEEIEQML
ncbi:MAG: hypothetical protein IT259_18415 [Saprospiraceae bacterium]|nr:hypothetical protein [Saprospiraceae bacterium]